MPYKRKEFKCQPKLCLECQKVPNKKCVDKWEELFEEEIFNIYTDSSWCKEFKQIGGNNRNDV